ncbi:TRAP transporter small permease [Halalkalibacter alkalisediminis]|uniref:TRAP transporter small permease n=1 Tax=Halalkalibacter alkalisediminis TaxID=935616 RepID=A0ABV6NI01_9BACI|nr:TRAP transporter small permease [Halalkalibacter alkalisediminis]
MFIRLLEKIQLSIGVIFLVIFFIAILIQVISRYLGISIIWTEEVATNAFIWAVFMGAAVMVNRKDHFNFDLLSKLFKGKKRLTLSIVNDSILLIFCAALFFYSLTALTSFWNYNWVTLPMIKMGYVWLALPVMTMTMVIYLVAHIVGNVKQMMVGEGSV